MQLQRPEIQQALVALFGAKGSVDFDVEQNILPVVSVADLSDTPYLRYGIPVGEAISGAAAAANFNYLVTRPGALVALQIKKIIVRNPNAVAAIKNVRLLTAANVALLGAATSTAQLADLAGVVGEVRSSALSRHSHNANSVGNLIAQFELPANSQVIFDLPDPGIILFGNDPGGRPGVAVSDETANEIAGCTLIGKEWPLPG